MKDTNKIRNLVGDITEQDLLYVDSYVSRDIGIFIPSVGFCGYAVQKGHTHPTYSFAIFPNREANVINLEPVKTSADQYGAAILPPGVPHEEVVGDRFVRYIAIMLSAPVAETLYQRYQVQPYQTAAWQSFGVPRKIMLLLERFMEEYEAVRSDDTVLDALGYLIANELIKSSAGIIEVPAVSGSRQIQYTLDYIQQHFAGNLSVHELAAAAGVSEATFSRQFKQETGDTPAAYILKVRLKKARKLMHDQELRLTDIALSCGFSSSAHLTSCFKKHFQLTPSEYRSIYLNI